jgi:hypothetical protein
MLPCMDPFISSIHWRRSFHAAPAFVIWGFVWENLPFWVSTKEEGWPPFHASANRVILGHATSAVSANAFSYDPQRAPRC